MKLLLLALMATELLSAQKFSFIDKPMTGEPPYYFSVPVPEEGNYKVTPERIEPARSSPWASTGVAEHQ